MNYYMAPLEGITGYIFRRAYHNNFPAMDKYFTPFLVPHTKKGFSVKEKDDILPEHNAGMYVVPQIMSNDAQMFLDTVKKLQVFGYEEVNLNLGCPSKTVVSKYRGSGFLAQPEKLERFLDAIYEKVEIKVSIKTRVGKESPDEFRRLLEIYNQYPVEELIIHPRVQQDFYKYTPRLDCFRQAIESNRHVLCYNGDIFSVEDDTKIRCTFPQIDRIMLGRGILGCPALLSQFRLRDTGKQMDLAEQEKERCAIQGFLTQIREDYLSIGMGEKHTLFKLKELWCYLGNNCPGGDVLLAQIRKSQTIEEYIRYEQQILHFFNCMHSEREVE